MEGRGSEGSWFSTEMVSRLTTESTEELLGVL